MKKILIAVNETAFPAELLAFPNGLFQGDESSLLTILMLPQVRYADLWSFGGSMAGLPLNEVVQGGELEVEQNRQRIAIQCQQNNIRYRIHQAPVDFTLEDILLETRFADLLILSAFNFERFVGIPDPSRFFKELIAGAECPVLLAPASDPEITELILAYDGHGSSVHAFKTFAAIFPELAELPATLVHVNDSPGDRIPAQDYLEELLPRHYRQLELMKLHLNSGKQFAAWLEDRPQALLISGAFGRSALSQLLRKSFVSDVIAAGKLPVFIAHR